MWAHVQFTWVLVLALWIVHGAVSGEEVPECSESSRIFLHSPDLRGKITLPKVYSPGEEVEIQLAAKCTAAETGAKLFFRHWDVRFRDELYELATFDITAATSCDNYLPKINVTIPAALKESSFGYHFWVQSTCHVGPVPDRNECSELEDNKRYFPVGVPVQGTIGHCQRQPGKATIECDAYNGGLGAIVMTLGANAMVSPFFSSVEQEHHTLLVTPSDTSAQDPECLFPLPTSNRVEVDITYRDKGLCKQAPTVDTRKTEGRKGFVPNHAFNTSTTRLLVFSSNDNQNTGAMNAVCPCTVLRVEVVPLMHEFGRQALRLYATRVPDMAEFSEMTGQANLLDLPDGDTPWIELGNITGARNPIPVIAFEKCPGYKNPCPDGGEGCPCRATLENACDEGLLCSSNAVSGDTCIRKTNTTVGMMDGDSVTCPMDINITCGKKCAMFGVRDCSCTYVAATPNMPSFAFVCNQEPEKTLADYAAVIGGGIGGLFFLIMLIIGAVIVRKRRNAKYAGTGTKRKSARHATELSAASPYGGSVAAAPSTTSLYASGTYANPGVGAYAGSTMANGGSYNGAWGGGGSVGVASQAGQYGHSMNGGYGGGSMGYNNQAAYGGTYY